MFIFLVFIFALGFYGLLSVIFGESFSHRESLYGLRNINLWGKEDPQHPQGSSARYLGILEIIFAGINIFLFHSSISNTNLLITSIVGLIAGVIFYYYSKGDYKRTIENSKKNNS